MRVLVTGGRDYTNVQRIWRVLDWLDTEEGRVRLLIDGASDDVTGPYIGADYWAHQWALARNKPTCRTHADWKAHGRAAGPIRNGKMLAEQKPDVVVAFPGGNGTADMVKQARDAGMRVISAAPSVQQAWSGGAERSDCETNTNKATFKKAPQ